MCTTQRRTHLCCALAKHLSSCFNCYGEALLLADMIEEQYARGCLNGDSQRRFGGKEVNAFAVADVCDCPLDDHGRP